VTQQTLTPAIAKIVQLLIEKAARLFDSKIQIGDLENQHAPKPV